MERSKIAIIIPAFNEEKTIQKVISSLREYGTLFVINDASSDNTLKILTKNRKIKIINNRLNLGYEASINKGFKMAFKMGFDFFITYDADDQFYSKDIKKIVYYFSNGYDLVVCNRKKLQRFSENIFYYISNILYKAGDPLCGLKGYSRKLYSSLGSFDNGKLCGTELMFYGISNNFFYKKMRVNVKKRYDKSRFGVGMQTEIYILRSILFTIRNFFIK